MTDEWLTGLALMYIHPEVEIDINEVINRFASMPPKLKSGKRCRQADTDAGDREPSFLSSNNKLLYSTGKFNV